ncbi:MULTISPECIES: hypothetical protein [unclassified Corallococcus]|uniref:hypothetical protein n=1 Tax=unclassified Corallococcus TaxID=2685029 RepID=UPI001A9063DA|nr:MULTISPECIES: hypothetical protein [unclassified Corallococcus]MBN9685389.1 hypothetical protein [Corallococcus sp. NCSPR001]WAS83160.1 hypothetical protein O0N60_28045 [Corallococcus sp. NCRR]
MGEKKYSGWHILGAFLAGNITGAGGAVAVGEATDSIRSPAEREAAQKARAATAAK